MTTLLLKSSLFGDAGQSSQLATEFARRLGGHLLVRDLARQPVPHLTAERFQAFLAKPEDRTTEQRAFVEYSDGLISELEKADNIVIGLPMYNFALPSTLKAYFDHVARAGVTFKYTEKGPVGLLTDKKAYVVVARGGLYGHNHAHATYVRDFLVFLGITDVQFVYVEGLAVSPATKDAALAEAKERIAGLALKDARAALI